MVETKKNAEIIRRAAEKEADLILQQAEDEAKRKVMSIQLAVSELTREVEDLEKKRMDYIEKLRHLADRQISILEFYDDLRESPAG